MMMDVCPLYMTGDAKPWANCRANAGLVFNKFADGWVKAEPWKFDPDKWLSRFASTNAGEREFLKEAARRQRELIEHLGGKVFAFKNSSRFVMGLGNAHPLENGLTWHPTLGVPYLPGSSIKGVLRSWDLQEFGEEVERNRLKPREEGAKAFGGPGGIGELIFFDLLPLKPVKLVREIMTPHYGGYYQEKNIPGDWESPVPIQYLAVEVNQEWQLGIAFHKREGKHSGEKPSPPIWGELEKLVSDALVWAGAGAKTAIGFGRFDRVSIREDAWAKAKAEKGEQEKLRQEEEANRQARERARASLAPELAEIQRQAENENWLNGDEPHATIFPDKLEIYLNDKSYLHPEVKRWLRKCFEKRDKKLWSTPEKTKKQKWIDLVKKVKAMKESSP